MTRSNTLTRSSRFAVACSFWLATLAIAAHADDAPTDPLVRQMAGMWTVEQRMWGSADAQPTILPDAIARRRLVGNAFIEEIMEAVSKSPNDAFTRTAYFNFNSVSQQYEYFSLDTRAPQMMNERGGKPASEAKHTPASISLEGGRFVAGKWGTETNVPFTYRLTIGEIKNARQVVQLFLTPQSQPSAKEFLAFEYLYTRAH
jgi:hypothetical protein